MDTKSRCLACSWMGDVVYKPCEACAQHDADAELGRAVRELAERKRHVAIDAGVTGGAWIVTVGLSKHKTPACADTLDAAVRKAWEGMKQ